MDHRFVGLPKDARGKTAKTYLYAANRKTRKRQVLWGDWLTVTADLPDGWLEVLWGPTGSQPETLYIPKAHTTDERPLEIVFLDVGQGDGAVLIAPEPNLGEAVVVIDAGVSEHMYEFLLHRFRSYNTSFKFHAAIITHPDIDHYGGFEPIFAWKNFGFKTIYQNGLVERLGGDKFDKLGGKTKDATTGISYVGDLAQSRVDIERHFGTVTSAERQAFAQTMKHALDNPNIGGFAMLSARHGTQEDGRSWLPGFAPSDQRGFGVEVLGPVPEPDAAGKDRLRVLGDYGETKNGHSVILRLHYGDFKILFGGDLNEKAEKYLLCHYGGAAKFPKIGTPAYEAMIARASERLRSDVMKVCHHGSEKVTDAFLDAVNPAAFVISSGDEEGHIHPRPDLLGRLGKRGRGDAPVILSTELQRSVREAEDEKLVQSLQSAVLKLAEKPDKALRDRIINDIWTLGRSNVTVYGTVYVKTNGKRLIAAFRIETGSEIEKWFTFEYALNPAGELVRVD